MRADLPLFEYTAGRSRQPTLASSRLAPAQDGPDRLDPSVPDAVELVVEKERRVAVPCDELHVLPHPGARAWRRQLDRRVLGRHVEPPHLAEVERRRER